jgi:hypothetical protein
MQGGKAGEDSHRKFNAGWKTGRPWLDFRKVTTTDHNDSAGNSVLVTAMFCKWCEMAKRAQPPVVCMCSCVGVCVCVCVCVRACARRRYVFVIICICIF